MKVVAVNPAGITKQDITAYARVRFEFGSRGDYIEIVPSSDGEGVEIRAGEGFLRITPQVSNVITVERRKFDGR